MIKAKYETRLLVGGTIKASVSGKVSLPEDWSLYSTVSVVSEQGTVSLVTADKDGEDFRVLKTSNTTRVIEAAGLATLAIAYTQEGVEYVIEVVDVSQPAKEGKEEEDEASDLYTRLATGKSGGHLSEETLANIRKERKSEHGLGITLFPNA